MMMLGSKRPAPGGDDDDESFQVMVPQPKRRATLKNAVRNIMGVGGLSLNKIVLNLEPMLRSWVREAVETAIMSSLQPSSRSSLNQIEASSGRRLQLRFVDKLPSTLFTGSKVEAEDGNSIRILLFDATSQAIVSSGPLSCIKVEIVVLNGDFGADERQDWTENEFNASLLREREGKRPLVTGDLNVTLVDGVGTVDNVIFTDNSSWIRSRKFRLGARMVQRTAGDQVTIREATSEAFMVKDHRGELYKKHYPPFPRDEVWRLERIAKGGAFHDRLKSKNIRTVKDFLRLQVTDPSELRNILGGGISNRVWDAIIEHALTCVLDDDEWYTYYGAAQRVGLVLNSIYQVLEVTFDGQNYLPVEKLTFSQKLLVEDAKRQAYKNVGNLVVIDRRAVTGVPSMLFTDLLPEQLGTSNLLTQQHDFSAANQDQPDMTLGFNQPSTSYAYEVEDLNHLPGIEAFNPMLTNNFSFRLMDGIFPYNEDNGFSLFPDSDFVNDHNNPQAQMPSVTSTTPAWAQGNGFILTPEYGLSSIGILSSSPSFVVSNRSMGETRDACPKARWLKLRAVIQWRSIRRGAARKRPWLPEGGSHGRSCYYTVLGIRKDASFSDIRTAYRKLALKWHPDRYARNQAVAGEAKLRFQQIQEAYSVLSNGSKRSMYDATLYDPLEDQDQDFCDFMQEMISMMNNVKDEENSFEDLQRMFSDMVGGDGMSFDVNTDPTKTKRPHYMASKSKSNVGTR